jgi:hypothetical protein
VDCFARGSFQNLNPILFGRGLLFCMLFSVIFKNISIFFCSKKESIPKELLDAFKVCAVNILISSFP